MSNRGPRAYFAELRRAVLDGPGVTSTALRRAVAGLGPAADVPASLAALVDKIRRHAYKVTDDDVAAARAAGHDDDALFEVTCAAAVGVALHRGRRAFAAIGAGDDGDDVPEVAADDPLPAAAPAERRATR